MNYNLLNSNDASISTEEALNGFLIVLALSETTVSRSMRCADANHVLCLKTLSAT